MRAMHIMTWASGLGLLASSAWADSVDPSLPVPGPVSAQQYYDRDGAPGDFVLLTFDAVPGAAYYAIYRQIWVEYEADATGQLVPVEPTAYMIPWGHADAHPEQSIVRVVVAALDDDAVYGVAAVFLVDGVAYRSQIALAPRLQGAATSAAAVAWGQVKGRRRP